MSAFNKKPLTAKQRDLAAANLGLAVTVALDLSRHDDSVRWLGDDAFSEAFLALVKAARGWKQERGVPFAGYARRAIMSEVRRAAQREVKQSHVPSGCKGFPIQEVLCSSS